MDTQAALQKYPELRGLHIPHTGEIIHWGEGAAIVFQSPLDDTGPLMIISVNGLVSGPHLVRSGLCMGPHEAMSLECQKKTIVYYDECFGERFVKLFERYPSVKHAWDAYRKRIQTQSEQ